MASAQDLIVECIRKITLPEDHLDVIGPLLSADQKTFEAQEGTYWDYKRDFPFSYSDDFFGGIVRLVCGFYNTYGGIIIFGVHDKTRDAGHNRVNINIEKFNTRLREVLNHEVTCIHRRYELNGQPYDIILVGKRDANTPPVKLSIDIGKYKADTLWLRKGHEVLEATSADLSLLYGARASYGLEANLDEDFSIPAEIPPSPATIREFVGRVGVMDRLFSWLVEDDQPWIFLYGKGGSGKSTIAHEFACLIRREGRALLIGGQTPIDRVIYLSAKAREFNPKSGKEQEFAGRDFRGAEELFRNILILAEWDELERLEKLDIKQLQLEIKSLLDLQCLFLVIDDIDTLTTNKVDPGMDFLHLAFAKAKLGGKILYTLRNLPAHSLASSIEVPGLSVNGEYQSFVSTCCRQFNTSEPSQDQLLGVLAEKSERRPLVIEAIVGLRRTAGNYENALKLLETRSGDDVRGYLFDREWNALPPDNRSRYLLAALALLNQKATFGDLEAVLQFDAQQVNDAIGQVFEMFLVVENGEQTRYSLGQVTKTYLIHVSQKLDLYPVIKERVSNYLKNFHPKNREISQMKAKADMYIARRNAHAAWEIVSRRDLDPKVTEHPEYRMLKAKVAAAQNPPLIQEAREAFSYCVAMRYEDIQGMRDWFHMERASGFGSDTAEAVCQAVIQGKTYSKLEKAEFTVKRATILFQRARVAQHTNPTDAIKLLEMALDNHLSGYKDIADIGGVGTQKNFEFCRNTAFQLFWLATKNVGASAVFDWLIRLTANKCYGDPLVEPICEFLRELPRTRERNELNMRRGMSQKFASAIKRRSGFMFQSPDAMPIVERALEDAIREFDLLLK